ncbi:MAG TPA: hypothetical protein VKA23_00045, partial [Mariprofundaceae bacterium]|nr:hypothetical protein [Mariprofundaceae bacterium]
ATYLFSGEIKDEIPAYCGSSLIRLCKLIGHLGPRTLFRTYIHTFHIIQFHAMERLSEVIGQRELNGRTISALVPKMKTRQSHLKLPGRTINNICNFLECT